MGDVEKQELPQGEIGRRLGCHVIAELYGIAPGSLRNATCLMDALRQALEEARFNIVTEAGSHKFEEGGQGVTGFVLLSESHAAFHSYPECGYLALDLFSCGSQDPLQVVSRMAEALGAERVIKQRFRRGPACSGALYDTEPLPIEWES